MRNQAVNFQTEISKACSDWVVYYSSVTEVWGFFLFFYFIALFFYFIVPKSIPHYRLNTNFATPVSRLSSFISCGVPFFLIFTILYESIYPLFTNENSPVKMLPLFLIEGRQWKWGYRLNFAGLLEYSNLQKVVGNSVHTRLPSLGAHATMDLYQKLNSLFGTELLDNSLRLRTELLKGNRIGPSHHDCILAMYGGMLYGNSSSYASSKSSLSVRSGSGSKTPPKYAYLHEGLARVPVISVVPVISGVTYLPASKWGRAGYLKSWYNKDTLDQAFTEICYRWADDICGHKVYKITIEKEEQPYPTTKIIPTFSFGKINSYANRTV